MLLAISIQLSQKSIVNKDLDDGLSTLPSAVSSGRTELKAEGLITNPLFHPPSRTQFVTN
jgi:hypothetical protein